ncbi:MAG: hypothetical protein F4236_04560 [Acidimicrobiia bacterium]|nr:hypothetical protein [Acidimicrobiia bacterium]
MAALAFAVAGLVAAAACGSETQAPLDAGPGQEAAEPAPAAAAEAAVVPAPAPAAAPSSATPATAAAPPPFTTAAAAPVRPAQTAPSAAPTTPAQGDTSGVRTFPASEVWEALRQCQSQGDYGFEHPSGQHFGAYQFTVATWDRLATQRYTDLLGVLPSEATPADQDRMAYYLWIESGPARWPACSHVFTGDPPPVAAAASGADQAAPPTEATPEGVPADTLPAEVATPPPAAEDVQPEESAATTADSDLPVLSLDPADQPAVPPDVAGFPTPEQWEALRFCESSGNYGAVSPDRRYYGAYQFWPDTWDSVAGRNYPRLLGILPSAATTHDQDRMAYRLWEERGDQPWPVCGRHLRTGG